MLIPKKLKVGGLTYTVSLINNAEARDAAGLTDNQDLTIKVCKAKKEAMELTFIHEMLHAINYEMKETDIEFLAQSLYAVIHDNPQVFKGGD